MYRISIYVPELDLQFNHFLVKLVDCTAYDTDGISNAPFLNNAENFSRASWERAPSCPTLGLLCWLS